MNLEPHVATWFLALRYRYFMKQVSSTLDRKNSFLSVIRRVETFRRDAIFAHSTKREKRIPCSHTHGPKREKSPEEVTKILLIFMRFQEASGIFINSSASFFTIFAFFLGNKKRKQATRFKNWSRRIHKESPFNCPHRLRYTMPPSQHEHFFDTGSTLPHSFSSKNKVF